MRPASPRGRYTIQQLYSSTRPIHSPLSLVDRMAPNPASEGEPASAAQYHRHPKRLIFAPGDIAAPPPESAGPAQKLAIMPEDLTATPLPRHLLASLDEPISSGTSTPVANAAAVSHASRAHQFGTNPPLLYSHLHPNPLHQFHTWFKNAKVPASCAPETCTLATVSMPAGRPSARIVYLKELDERGWVIYSNWGSRAGKGGQVFGNDRDRDGETMPLFDGSEPQVNEGNKWAALTFHWQSVERQVRIEGLIEPLSREESETYWRVRERGSQIGAWASQQSKRLWSNEDEGAVEGGDDGRSVLEDRVKEMEARFADVKEIPLPPFWGGVRLVPESVEFWQGRKSRLHDRFRYVRQHGADEVDGNEKTFRWNVERLSP